MLVAVQPTFAVRSRTAKNTLPCEVNRKRTAKTNARQRGPTAHDKEKAHGKASAKRTAMKEGTAKRGRRCREMSFAVRPTHPHGTGFFAVRCAQTRTAKAALPCTFSFAVCLVVFSSFSFYIVLILMLIFYS
jgi:hypothetical protein